MVRSIWLLYGFELFMSFKSEKIYKIIVFINMKFCLLYDFRELTLKFKVKTNLTKIKHNS
jgi:hypothetical protein